MAVSGHIGRTTRPRWPAASRAGLPVPGASDEQRSEEVNDGRATIRGRSGREAQPDRPPSQRKARAAATETGLPVVERAFSRAFRPGSQVWRTSASCTAASVLNRKMACRRAGVFFNCGHRPRIHRRMARSSLSRGSRGGRCSDVSIFCRSRHTSAGCCLTPVSRRGPWDPAGTSRDRSGTHAPRAMARPVSSWASWRRVQRPPRSPSAAFRPACFPSACPIWFHRCAATAATPSARATVACDSSRANTRAATTRRVSDAATRFVRRLPQHGLVPDETITIGGDS